MTFLLVVLALLSVAVGQTLITNHACNSESDCPPLVCNGNAMCQNDFCIYRTATNGQECVTADNTKRCNCYNGQCSFRCVFLPVFPTTTTTTPRPTSMSTTTTTSQSTSRSFPFRTPFSFPTPTAPTPLAALTTVSETAKGTTIADSVAGSKPQLSSPTDQSAITMTSRLADSAVSPTTGTSESGSAPTDPNPTFGGGSSQSIASETTKGGASSQSKAIDDVNAGDNSNSRARGDGGLPAWAIAVIVVAICLVLGLILLAVLLANRKKARRDRDELPPQSEPEPADLYPYGTVDAPSTVKSSIYGSAPIMPPSGGGGGRTHNYGAVQPLQDSKSLYDDVDVPL